MSCLCDDSDSETDCSTWDEDSVVVKIEPKDAILGFNLGRGIHPCSPSSDLEPASKQPKISLELNHILTDREFLSVFHKNWKNRHPLVKGNIELFADPFQVCVINNFLQNDFLTNKLISEFNELEWNKRNLDLYEFYQSADLKHVESRCIQIMYDFLKKDVKNWLENATGQELVNISATCSLYGDTDYLLIHDDQQEDRLIAFIFYFTGPRQWHQKHGGALQLFSKDEHGQPNIPVKDIFPLNNQFVFFQVSNDSYHQVAEVINKEDCRMSINGWFHSKVCPVFTAPHYVPPESGLFSSNCLKPQDIDLSLESWINPIYLEETTAKNIQDHIEEQSEISLHDYFKPEAFEEVLSELKSSEMKWIQVGPPNRRLYEVASSSVPAVVQRFLSLFQSYQMFGLLRQYTDLDLISMRFELQRWTPGYYSLLTDYDWYQKNELDLILYLGCQPDTVIGGRVMYLATDEEIQQALITLDPEENNLNVVFRDTARITKYVSKSSICSEFYLLICSYSEQ